MAGLFPMSAPVIILPVLTWQESMQQFGVIYPDSGEYKGLHAHRHDGCGHIVTCAFAGDGPCQAYEVHGPKCTDCAIEGLRLLGSWCADWWLPRELRGTGTPVLR